MQSTRRAAAYPGTTRHQRLVKPTIVRRSRDDQTRHTVRSDQWDALMIGLRGADILQQRFADFYATHVSGRSTRPAHLVGTVQSLFSLVEARGVELPDLMDIRTDRSDPLAALQTLPNHIKSDSDALAALDTCRWSLESFHPIVYGQTHEVEPLFDGGQQNVLALLLWVLADQTRWSLAADDIQEIIDYAVSEMRPERARFADRMTRLHDQRWPRDLPMDELGRQLDQMTYHGLNLGKAVRYTFSATGLQFADLSLEELDEMGWAGMDWYRVDFDSIAAEQAEAQAYLQHDPDLDTLVSSQPEVFDALLALLTEAVTRTQHQACPAMPATDRASQAGGAK